MGVIGSLGVRRDAKAVEAIAKLLGGADAGVAQAAARALGNIGTPEAAQALDAALDGAQAQSNSPFAKGSSVRPRHSWHRGKANKHRRSTIACGG